WLGLWVRTAYDERPRLLPLLLLGALPSILVYEKLNNVVLLGPLAVMMFVADPEDRARRGTAMTIGFLIGLIPFVLVNVLGHGISFQAAVQPNRGASAADLAAFVTDILALGDGNAARELVLGVHSAAWMRAPEILF